MEDTELNVNYVYKIGTRTALIMGCDRSLLILLFTLCGVCAFALQSIIGCVIAIVIFLVCLSLLRQVAKADPRISEVYIKPIKFKKYYPAHATHFGVCNKTYK